jgi:hypothetical protein
MLVVADFIVAMHFDREMPGEVRVGRHGGCEDDAGLAEWLESGLPWPQRSTRTAARATCGVASSGAASPAAAAVVTRRRRDKRRPDVLMEMSAHMVALPKQQVA